MNASRSRLARGAAAGLVALAIGPGCRTRRAPESDGEAPTVALPRPAPPVDQLLPGELAEGTEVAFGLKLPRKMQVSARFADVVVGKTDVPSDQVANYVRQRVSADRVVTGP